MRCLLAECGLKAAFYVLAEIYKLGSVTPRGSLEGAGKEKIDKVMMKNAMQI